MKKLLAAISVVSAVTFAASTASAQWAPAPSGPHTVSGDLIVRHMLPFDLACPFSGTVSIDASGVATLDGPYPRSLCTSGLGTGVTVNAPIIISKSGTSVTLSGLNITSLGGTCTGSVTGTIVNPPAPPPTIIDIPYQVVAGPNFPPCYIGGRLTVNGVI